MGWAGVGLCGGRVSPGDGGYTSTHAAADAARCGAAHRPIRGGGGHNRSQSGATSCVGKNERQFDAVEPFSLSLRCSLHDVRFASDSS